MREPNGAEAITAFLAYISHLQGSELYPINFEDAADRFIEANDIGAVHPGAVDAFDFPPCPTEFDGPSSEDE